jgi:hypothetical protein
MQCLSDFTAVVCQPQDFHQRRPKNQPLRTLIPRYPYLYHHCLVSDDSSYEHQQMIRQIKLQKQQQFELDLSQYVTRQWRRIPNGKGFSRNSKTNESIRPQSDVT